jgi:hypothetical protein
MPGQTQTVLRTGLGAALGCNFRAAQNQLISVEFATGSLSALTVALLTHTFSVPGTGYNRAEDVKLSVAGATGDLLRINLTTGVNRTVVRLRPSGNCIRENGNILYLREP